jgi:hypothetical protein
MSVRFVIGDCVKPKPEWEGDPNCVPSGSVRAVASFGKDGAIYVIGDHRAFAAYVFDKADSPVA